MSLTAIEQVAARAVDRDLWARYGRAKDAAALAGACRRCRIEIALAAVTEPGRDAQPHEPKLCGRCERIWKSETPSTPTETPCKTQPSKRS